MREFLLSLGIMLGIVSAQPDPQLAARAYRDSTTLFVTAEVRDVLGKEALALARAGDTLRLNLELRSEAGATAGLVFGPFHHDLIYDPISRIWSIELSENGAHHQTSDARAAVDIFSRFYGLYLGELATLGFPLKLRLKVQLADASNSAVASDLLWNLKTPETVLESASLSELPW